MKARVLWNKDNLGEVEWQEGILTYSTETVKGVLDDALRGIPSPLMIRGFVSHKDGHDDTYRPVFHNQAEWFKRAIRRLNNVFSESPEVNIELMN